MNIGLPGTGLGGLFYMMSILIMFIIEISKALVGKRSPYLRLALKQATMLVGIIISMLALDWFLGMVILSSENAIHGSRTVEGAPSFLSITPIVLTSGLLGFIIIVISLVGLALKKQEARRTP